jgi:hypothetical protein
VIVDASDTIVGVVARRATAELIVATVNNAEVRT